MVDVGNSQLSESIGSCGFESRSLQPVYTLDRFATCRITLKSSSTAVFELLRLLMNLLAMALNFLLTRNVHIYKCPKQKAPGGAHAGVAELVDANGSQLF